MFSRAYNFYSLSKVQKISFFYQTSQKLLALNKMGQVIFKDNLMLYKIGSVHFIPKADLIHRTIAQEKRTRFIFV